ncbi:MAG: hypothetical protein ACOCXH_01560 [Cyclobacteriaceae bacterium]
MKNILRVYLLSVLFLGCTGLGFAQKSGDYNYESEVLWGVTKATNSGLIGGVMLRFGNSIGDNKYHNFGLELVNVKHPQEEREHKYFGSSVINSKLNYLYSIRLQYGREWLLFRKAPQQGVQVSGNLSAGPTIGLESPYYVELRGDQNGTGRGQRVPYNPNISPDNIIGAGAVFQGLDESKIVPGINLKSSVSFEFGTFKSNVVGFEVGMMVEAFTRTINIMAHLDNNRQIYPNAFITLFYGSRN